MKSKSLIHRAKRILESEMSDDDKAELESLDRDKERLTQQADRIKKAIEVARDRLQRGKDSENSLLIDSANDIMDDKLDELDKVERKIKDIEIKVRDINREYRDNKEQPNE
jgi:uncharacterized protein YoxC